MARFFIEKHDIDLIHKKAALTDSEDVKHLARVLRMTPGETVALCDGVGCVYNAVITEVGKTEVLFDIISESEDTTESPVHIHLYQGIPKGEKMEMVVQKCTELGVTDFYPVETKRCVVVLKDDKTRQSKQERWQKIVREAAKQSYRTAVPVVHMPGKFKTILKTIPDYDAFIVPYELEGSHGLKAAIETLLKSHPEGATSDSGRNTPMKIAVFIGPEGGFEVDEIDQLIAAGAHAVTLGKRILRTETAGLTAVAILQHVLGDLG